MGYLVGTCGTGGMPIRRLPIRCYPLNTIIFAAPQFLVKKRVDVDAGDFFKVTALHLAAIENHPDIVEVLLKSRADPKPADVEGDLPIHWAATKGHTAVGSPLIT